METIVAVRENPKNPGQGFVRISDGATPPVIIEAWTPEFAKAAELNGKPIPEGWLLKDNKAGTGKVLLPPKAGGSGGGYRNTREAFEAEAKSRAAWQEVEEEAKDRRTALMQAIEYAKTLQAHEGPNGPMYVMTAEVLNYSAEFFQWLRSSVSAPVTTGDQGAAGPGEGVLTPSPGHQALSGGTTAVIGEGATDPPGKGLFPLRPEDCDHKTKTGRWLPTRIIDGQARCPRCGLSAVIYRESAA